MRLADCGIKIALGLLSVIYSYSFLFVSPAYAQVSQQQINNSLCSGANIDFTGTSTNCTTSGGTSINDFVSKIINILSLIVGAVAVIMIIVGGLRYITSGGSDSSVTGAKNTILYAIIGLVIVALAQVIVHFVLNAITSSAGG